MISYLCRLSLLAGFMRRTERVADTIREEIAQIVGYELEDPRLTMVTVTDVRLSGDKRDAKVYVTIAGNEDEHKAALAALKHAAPYVRKQLGLTLIFHELQNYISCVIESKKKANVSINC
jgi:ribosome-binding factor A